RERHDDIAVLGEHIRRQANARYGLSVAGVTTEALEVLLGHSWPGNVRELEAALAQPMIFQGNGWFKPGYLQLPLMGDRCDAFHQRRRRPGEVNQESAACAG